MPLFRYLKRKWLLKKPLPDEWEDIIHKKVPVIHRLPGHLQERLKQRAVILIDEKHFEGCGGLELTGEMILVIACYASVLILEEPADYYGGLQSILVYPEDYLAPFHEEYEGGIVSEGYESRSGEYWGAGNIVLSWKDIQRDLYSLSTGNNLIYHEFSHLLDDRYGLTAGISAEGTALRDDEWTQIVAKAYRRHLRDTATGRYSVVSAYGATSPAEFFSVATEVFIEKPSGLKSYMPGLYSMLSAFYRIDPVSWR